MKLQLKSGTKVLVILFLTLLSSVCVFAQTTNPTVKLSGKLFYAESNELKPLAFGTVRLYTLTDSVLVAGTSTGENGIYEFKAVKPGNYRLLASCVGYQNITKQLVVDGASGLFIVDDITLGENSVVLKEATVTGKRSAMVSKGDTTEFNASAYRLRENALAEDMLKRLPGITITDDGKILVNGKEVKKVMVDGKDFFRSNPNLSIKNIPAEIMDKLQIIEDKSELAKLTGVDDGEENFTINITIQKNKKRGWLLSSNLGGGKELKSDEGNLVRYSVNTFMARIMDESQTGVVANGNNINGMSVGTGGSTTGSGKPGLNSSLSGGLNFSSGKPGISPLVLNGDVSYGFNDQKLIRNSIRQYFLQDSTSYQTDSSRQVIRDNGLRFSAKVESRALQNWVFSFTPSGSITTNTRDNTGYSLLQAGNARRDSVNSNHYNIQSKAPGCNLGGVFTVTHDFEKKGRKLSLSIDSRYSNYDGNGTTDAQYYYYRNSPASRVVNRNQEWNSSATSYTNRIYASWVEPVGEKSSLQFVYWVQTEDRENLKNNYKLNPLTGEFDVIDIPYSKSLRNFSLSQQVSTNFHGVFNKIIYTLGFSVTPSYTRSTSFIQNGASVGGDSTITFFPGYRTLNYAPNAYLMYNMGKGKNLRFDYRGRSEAPSVFLLDPSRDESNPTNIRMGNPDLVPKFTHWTRLRYTANNRAVQQSFLINVEANYIQNDIINYTTYDGTTGIKTTMPVNKSGSWNANGLFMYNRPLSSVIQVNNYLQAGLKNNIGYAALSSKTSSQETVATTLNLNEELTCTFKWDCLFLTTKALYQLGNTRYSVEGMLPNNTSAMGGAVNAQFTLPASWYLTSNLNYRDIKGFSAAYNRTEMLWNVEISKSFLARKAATLTLVLNDILQQQRSVAQIVSSNYVEDQEFNTLKSFVMLAFSYRFNRMGK